MAHDKKRFTFDDDETIQNTAEEVSTEAYQTPVVEEATEELDVVIPPLVEANILGEQGAEPMGAKKKKKRKFRFKIWYIPIILIIVFVAGFFIYVYSAANTNGPVYGNRCQGLLALDDGKMQQVEKDMEEDGNIENVTIAQTCRTVEITISLGENATADDAMILANATIAHLDNALGYQKEEGQAFSQAFGYANGAAQYNVTFRLTKTNGDNSAFPIFGTKHPKNDTVSFTTALSRDQATTDYLLGSGEEEATDEGETQE